MRHRLGYRKLNRNPATRKALLKGLASQLIFHGKIVTTLERAKEIRGVVEPLVTLAKSDCVANRRLAASRLIGSQTVERLFKSVAPVFTTRPGGYTRIVRLGFRAGDHARRALIEFVETSAHNNSAAPQTDKALQESAS